MITKLWLPAALIMVVCIFLADYFDRRENMRAYFSCMTIAGISGLLVNFLPMPDV